MSITSVIRGCFLGVTLILSSSSAISQTTIPGRPGPGPGVDAPDLSNSSTAAQLVAGEGGGVRYSTTVTAKNRSDEICDIWGKIFGGGGRTTISALDLNGQRLPTSGIFTSTVAPNGIQVYELKQPPQVSGINLFAGKFQTDKNCAPHVDFSVQYFINGGIDDVFSYLVSQEVPQSACAQAPIKRSPGAAFVAENLLDLEVESALLDPSGNLVDERTFDWDGQHKAEQAINIHPSDKVGPGTWRLCFMPKTSRTDDDVGVTFLQDDRNLLLNPGQQILSPGCTPDKTTACSGPGRRFKVEVAWTSQDQSGEGMVVERNNITSVFYFFNPENLDLLVQVLDECSNNDHFWVFANATTNVEYGLTVTDTATGMSRVYENELGQAAQAITDTSAFATCP